MKLNHKKAMLTVSAVLVCLLIAEVTVRLLKLGPDIAPVYWGNYRLSTNPDLGYELVPGSPDGETFINSDGMRDIELSVEKPKQTVRIACIGDSICYGLEVPQQDTFPARLEGLLLQYFGHTTINFEVMNFGVTGYNISQTVENLRSKALKYKPDIIIYAYCLNEPQKYSFEMASLQSMLTNAEKQFVLGTWSRSLIGKSRLLLLTRYALRAKTSSGLKKGNAPKIKSEEKVWSSLYSGTYPDYFKSLYESPEAWGDIEEGLDELSAISRKNKIPVFVAVFPVLMHFDRYPLNDIHEKVSLAAKRRTFEVIDLLEMFKQYETIKKKRVGWDALHPNAEGHGVVAISLMMDLCRKKPLSNIPGPQRQPTTGAQQR